MTAVTKYVFNTEPLKYGKTLPSPRDEDYPPYSFKYGEIETVRSMTSDYVREVIDSAPIGGKHKNVMVDVKVHDLLTGRCPCLPGWHCDSVVRPDHPSQPELHHIFVTGIHCLTLFIAEPVELDLLEEDESMQHLNHSFNEQIKEKYPNVKTTEVDSCRIATFGRWDFHTGQFSKGDERRLLIRVSESDIIKPRNDWSKIEYK